MTHQEYLKLVGLEFRIAKIRKGLSTPELCKLTGLSKSCINMMENGKTDVKILTYKRVADALGIQLKDIL
ncbi:MAG: hypothetical protein POELPBGB_01243 [Bacteroidia bacterium]|nr:hypothetical protein [Bacteroidia bacterium]